MNKEKTMSELENSLMELEHQYIMIENSINDFTKVNNKYQKFINKNKDDEYIIKYKARVYDVAEKLDILINE